ncbi:MAG: LysM peptidoglycan-binding domain-containing protein [Clostridia bacterium]|nr:LysM peptidoglycan-binding domain-containing protein [Clostridia bacterium]
MIIHTVAPGDTISSIAARYGVPAGRIILDNELPGDTLSPGQALIIVYHSRVHTVAPGDSLYSIAARYGVSVNQLWRNNPSLGGRGELYPGQTIVIDYADAKRGSLQTTGYVYPFVTEDVLRRTLPYLTYLAIFSYGIRADGSLVVPDDERLIALAEEYGAKPMLVLTSLGDDGRFSTETVSAVLNNPAAVDELISNIVETMEEKGYVAINSDFEYIAPGDRDVYTAFIRQLTNALRPRGWLVDVSLAPKTSGDQPGLLYEAIDYPALAAAADTVFLMTYEWGYTYSEPRAVAPINLVEQVVDYALSVMSREKINMGMPNYGYNWRLPWIQGTAAQSLPNQAAVALANEYGATINFDETAKTPWFRYFDGESQHEVWFEDARSVDAKLALAAGRRLNGVGVWNVTRWFPQLWFVLNVLYNIERG